MTTTYVTLINSEGDIVSISTTGGVPSPAEGTFEQDNSLTVVHLPGNIESLALYRDTHYYKDGAFVARDASPGKYYYWKDEAWTLDSAVLMEEMRRDRNGRLYACDWTLATDSPLSDAKKAEWVEYRTALREVPAANSGATHLSEVVWPDQPS